MNALIDTHALIWFHEANPKLSTVALAAITNPANAIFVSAASYWEIAINLAIRRFGLAEPYLDFIQHAILDNGFRILPVEPRHTAELVALPFHHKDPFDRLLIAQAIAEDIPIVSADAAFDPYPIRRLW